MFSIQESEMNSERREAFFKQHRDLRGVIEPIVRTLTASPQYKDKISELWLYGSRARGDARPGSDIDLFCLLDSKYFKGEVSRLKKKRPASFDNCLGTFEGKVVLAEIDGIECKLIASGFDVKRPYIIHIMADAPPGFLRFPDKKYPLYYTVRAEGVLLYPG